MARQTSPPRAKTQSAAGGIEWVYDDGGRAEAEFKGETRDCVCRAVAIATGKPYREIYDRINELAKLERPRGGKNRSSARTGVHRSTQDKLMAELGFEWTPTMEIGAGCQVHLAAAELPSGRLVVRLSKHVAAVSDGVLHDLWDCSRNGTRCVYGFWTLPATQRKGEK